VLTSIYHLHLKDKISEWVNTGEAWTGNVPFPEYGRVAELVLPKYSGHTATLAFKMTK
jgi:hypothetical protein